MTKKKTTQPSKESKNDARSANKKTGTKTAKPSGNSDIDGQLAESGPANDNGISESGKGDEENSVQELRAVDGSIEENAEAPENQENASGTETPHATASPETTEAETGPSEATAATNPKSVVIDDNFDDSANEFEHYHEFTEKLKRFVSAISDQKEVVSEAGKRLKKLRDNLEKHIAEFKSYDPNERNLFNYAKNKGQPTTSNIETVSSEPANKETVTPSDEWKHWLAKDHFDFSEKEWELMAPSEGTADKMTVGELSEFAYRMEHKKVKGFGESKKQKLCDQFLKFWTDHPEFHTTENDVQPSTDQDEATESPVDEKSDVNENSDLFS